MAAKLLALACIRNDSHRGGGGLSPRPHYPSMPKYPKGVAADEISSEAENKALLAVSGMTCAACAGSVEKAIKRLPGIREAFVDVLNGRAQVLFYPGFVNVRLSHHQLFFSINFLFFFFFLCVYFLRFWICLFLFILFNFCLQIMKFIAQLIFQGILFISFISQISKVDNEWKLLIALTSFSRKFYEFVYDNLVTILINALD